MQNHNSKRKVLIICIILFTIVAFFIFLKNYKNKPKNPQSQKSDVERSLVETTDDPSWGNPDAKVVIVEFSDFECPYCRQEFPILRELGIEYKDMVRFIYRDFLGHEHSQKAAEAAQCANEQGKFLEYHDKLFLNQDNLSIDSLKSYARQVSVSDIKKFDQCLDEDKYLTEVQQDHTDGVSYGVKGTPTFFINGHKFTGTPPKEDLKEIIEYFLASEKK